MRRRAVAEIGRHEAALIRSEPLPVAAYLVMPIVLMAFVEDSFGVYLRFVEGLPDVSGALLAVPGQATMFAFMSTATLGYYYLGEHSWGTWNRMRALGVTSGEIVTGKLSIAYVQQLVQLALLFGVGMLAFGLRVEGSVLGLAAVAAAFALFVVAYGFLACAISRSQAQFNAFAYVGALLLAGLGGALVPFGTLPGWVQAIGRFTPTYWAVRGFRAALLERGATSTIVAAVLVLVVGAVVTMGLALWRFDPDERKSTYA
ncbi:MAG TPA: ABC transporter permease [Microthrixaceae bacterium]|nr:ABC transporter permease [Microthrixaceae bacterium]